MNDEAKQQVIDRSQGCLLLGAIGDALGAPVEFLNADQIVKEYGSNGIQYLSKGCGRNANITGTITDDTQMTLYLAEALIKTHKLYGHRPLEYWHHTVDAYQEWLKTQSITNPEYEERNFVSEGLNKIVTQQGRRAPGNTCISSLMNMPFPPVKVVNDSKGCGTVMRAAPIGIFFGHLTTINGGLDLNQVFLEGAKDAEITHGHLMAKESSGIMAVIIALIMNGVTPLEASRKAIELFATDTKHLLTQAVDGSMLKPDRDFLTYLGQGWVAEEALALAIYCAGLYESGYLNVAGALRTSVNHSGDSDSTGAITGNILGTYVGKQNVPSDFLDPISEVYGLLPILNYYGEQLITVTD